ncbi:MAG: hypothetical protein EPO26_13835 [Chloroflexota bacterium]|nr:MAG: hypothetical protein EPO26_13835 [Chloroflexota bacterium]
MRFSTGALVAASLTLALAACGDRSEPSSDKAGGGTGVSSGGEQSVAVKGMDTMKFEPATLTVKAGQPVRLILQNVGVIPHNFVLKQGAGQPVKITAAGGQTEPGIFTIARPGTYEFVCEEPGHTEAGMKGTITVR